MIDQKDYALVVPFAGLVWIISFIVAFLLPALKRSRREREKMDEQLEMMGENLRRVSIEVQVVSHRFMDQVDRIREIETTVISQMSHLKVDMGVVNARPSSTVQGALLEQKLCEAYNRIADLEQRMNSFEAEKKAVEDAAPAATEPEAPIPFEVYRADILKLWDGEVPIDDHVRKWSGVKVMPRPRPPAREVSA